VRHEWARLTVNIEDEGGCPFVVASLALPPPTNGQAMINASVVQRLKRMKVKLKLIDTSPRSHQRTIFYHLRRIAIVSSIPVVLGVNAWRTRRCLYTVAEPGLGMFYNFVVVGFARLLCYRIFLHHHASSYTKFYDQRFAALCVVAGGRAVHIALSEQMSSDLTALYKVGQAVVVHNASHIRDPGEHPRTHRTSDLTIGFLSNLSLEKGLDTVLQSFAAIVADGWKARLILAGPIVDERACALVKEAHAKYGDAIVELGAVAGDAKDAFFRAIDVFFFPSRYRFEAQPLVVLEALSYSAATLVTRQGYSGEIVEPLGTATELSEFINCAMEFVRAWSKDSDFAARQRKAARMRFLELAEASRYQNDRLFSLVERL
jgi:glycosyltransferase involved in cell wall biosynthesis